MVGCCLRPLPPDEDEYGDAISGTVSRESGGDDGNPASIKST